MVLARPAVAAGGRRARLGGRAVRGALVLVPAVFFAVFFAYPVAAIVGRGLRTEDGGWQPARLGEVLGRSDILDVLWFTTWQALASTALTLLVALPGAYVFARYDFPGRRLLRAVVTVPFVLPTVVVGTAFLALVGRGGLLDDLWGVRLDTTVWAILLAHVFFNYAVVVRTVGGLWAQLDPRQEEAARVLGASRFAAWRRITLPALAPAVAAAALMVFLFTYTSFGVVVILGGPAYRTLEAEIYRQTAQLPRPAHRGRADPGAVRGGRRDPRGARLDGAAPGGVPAPGRPGPHGPPAARRRAVGAARRGPRLRRGADPAAPRGARGPVLRRIGRPRLLPGADVRGRRRGHFRGAAAGGRGELAAVRAGRHRHRRGRRGLAAAALTPRSRPGAAGRTGPSGAGRLLRGFDALLMLPLGVSAVTVGFGFLIALDEPPLDLRQEWILVPLAQALVGVPFVVRTMLPVLRAVDERLREAAAVLGASPLRVWREVDLPMVRRAVLVAAGFAFAVSLGEFGATVFIARADEPTLPVAVARLLGRPGELNYGQAMALSTILMVVCAVALLLLERVRTDRTGEF